MKVTLTAKMEGNTNLETSAEVETFADLAKLGAKLQTNVKGVKKLLPDLAASKVVKVQVAAE